MKKWICAAMILLLIAVCACAAAEDAAPELTFAEQNRVNYKPVLKGNPSDFKVDSWLQKLAVYDEGYFWDADPNGPVWKWEQTAGPSVKTHLDDENVLRLDFALSSAAKITFRLSVEWAGQKAETNMYIEFYDCDLPKTIGFDDAYTLQVGDELKLDVNYDDGKWPHRTWHGLNPQHVSDRSVIDVYTKDYSDGTGISTYIRALNPGGSTVLLEANQDGLNWYKTVTIRVAKPESWYDSQGNEYALNKKKKTAALQKGSTESGTVIIPDTITVRDITYKVTEIASKAFSGNALLTEVTIGKNVKKIGSKAFYKCKKLELITLQTKKLKKGAVGKNAFKGIFKKATFKCPSKSKAKAYKTLLLAAGAPKKCKFTK